MVDFLRERWAAIVLTVVAVAFIAQNRVETTIRFLWLDVRWPLWLTLTIVALVGVVIGIIVNRRRSEH